MISYVLLQHKPLEQLSDLGYRDVQRRRHSLHARQVDSDKEPVMVEGTVSAHLHLILARSFWAQFVPNLWHRSVQQLVAARRETNLS